MNDKLPSPAHLAAQKKLAAAYRATYAIAALLIFIGVLVAIARESAPMGTENAIAIAISCIFLAHFTYYSGFSSNGDRKLP